jgi:hypothetical protein
MRGCLFPAQKFPYHDFRVQGFFNVGGIGRVGLYRDSRSAAEATRAIQQFAMQETRLGIPIWDKLKRHR